MVTISISLVGLVFAMFAQIEDRYRTQFIVLSITTPFADMSLDLF